MKKNNFTLSPESPNALQGHEIAKAEWTRVLNLPGHKITAFDENLLVQYCLVLEEEQGWKKFITEEIADNPRITKRQIESLRKRIRDKHKLLLTLARSLYVTPLKTPFNETVRP